MAFWKKPTPKPSPVAAAGNLILAGALMQLGAAIVNFVGETVSDALTARKLAKAAQAQAQATQPPAYAPRAHG